MSLLVFLFVCFLPSLLVCICAWVHAYDHNQPMSGGLICNRKGENIDL